MACQTTTRPHSQQNHLFLSLTEKKKIHFFLAQAVFKITVNDGQNHILMPSTPSQQHTQDVGASEL